MPEKDSLLKRSRVKEGIHASHMRIGENIELQRLDWRGELVVEVTREDTI